MGISISFSGTDKLLDAIPDAKRVEKRVEKAVRRYAKAKGIQEAKKDTPVDTGHLRGGWRAPQTQGRPLLQNEVTYAENVIGRHATRGRNRGHRRRFEGTILRIARGAAAAAEQELEKATKDEVS